MLMVFMRVLAMMAAFAVVGVIIGVLWVLGVHWIPLLVALAWCLVTAEGVAAILATVAVFRRFDPSVDTPA